MSKAKKEINVGDKITSSNIVNGKKVLNVDAIRVVDGINVFYVTAEGIQGTHAVPETDVENHATKEEWEKAQAEEQAEKDSDEDEAEAEELGNDTPDSSPTTSGATQDQLSEVGNGSESGTDSILTQPTTQDSSSAPEFAEQNKSNGGKQNQQNNGRKRV